MPAGDAAAEAVIVVVVDVDVVVVVADVTTPAVEVATALFDNEEDELSFARLALG